MAGLGNISWELTSKDGTANNWFGPPSNWIVPGPLQSKTCVKPPQMQRIPLGDISASTGQRPLLPSDKIPWVQSDVRLPVPAAAAAPPTPSGGSVAAVAPPPPEPSAPISAIASSAIPVRHELSPWDALILAVAAPPVTLPWDAGQPPPPHKRPLSHDIPESQIAATSFSKRRRRVVSDSTRSTRPAAAPAAPTPHGCDVLKEWLENNQRDPYPTRETVVELTIRSGIDTPNILKWFARVDNPTSDIFPLSIHQLSNFASLLRVRDLVRSRIIYLHVVHGHLLDYSPPPVLCTILKARGYMKKIVERTLAKAPVMVKPKPSAIIGPWAVLFLAMQHEVLASSGCGIY